MKYVYFWLFIIFLNFKGFAQSNIDVKQITNQPNLYYWGEGKAATQEKAKLNALADLTSKIRVDVQSNYTSQEGFGSGQQAFEKVQLVVNTYSNATLDNVKSIVLKDEETEFSIFFYIEKKEVEKLFEERLKIVFSNLHLIKELQEKNNIGNVLKYYSWSLMLLKSIPKGLQEKTIPEFSATDLNLYSFIKQKLDEVISKIQIKVSNVTKLNDFYKYELNFTFNNNPITNIAFTYKLKDGSYSQLYYANDGLTAIELYGLEKEANSLNIALEYLYKNEAISDPIYKNIIDIFDLPIAKTRRSIELNNNVANNNSPKFYKIVNTELISKVKNNNEIIPLNNNAPNNNQNTNLTNSKINNSAKITTESINNNLNFILQSIQQKNYQNIQSSFTNEAWQEFQKIIKLGNAQIMSSDNQNIKLDTLDNKIIVRPIKIQFKFNNNKRVFNENLVLIFNETGKIERLHLGLNEIAIQSIKEKKYAHKEEQLLINSMETYKTAYFLKDIDFLKAIFDENAYIIVGKVLNIHKKNDGLKKNNNQNVQLFQQSKKDFLAGLQRVFNSNEFVNIDFEKSLVSKLKANSTIFGINIKQNYYSASYGDQGYLFLLMDLKELNKPIIKVRTWQPLTDTIPPIDIQNYYRFIDQ